MAQERTEFRMVLPGERDNRFVTRNLNNAFLQWTDSSKTRKLYFQTVSTNGFSYSKTANYETVEVPGRNEPVHVWTGGGDKKIPLTLTFVATGSINNLVTNFANTGKPIGISYLEDNAYGAVLENLRALEALCYGRKNGTAPPKVRLRFGVLFRTKKTIPCIVESVDVQVENPGPFELNTYIPKVVTVELDLTASHDVGEVPSYESILDDIMAISPIKFKSQGVRVADTLTPDAGPKPTSFKTVVPTISRKFFGPRKLYRFEDVAKQITNQEGKNITITESPVTPRINNPSAKGQITIGKAIAAIGGVKGSINTVIPIVASILSPKETTEIKLGVPNVLSPRDTTELELDVFNILSAKDSAKVRLLSPNLLSARDTAKIKIVPPDALGPIPQEISEIEGVG